MKRKLLLVIALVLALVAVLLGVITYYSVAEKNPSIGRIKDVDMSSYNRAIVMHVLFPKIAQDWKYARLIPAKDCKLSDYSNEAENLPRLLELSDSMNKKKFLIDFLTINDQDGTLRKCLLIGSRNDNNISQVIYLNTASEAINISISNIPEGL
jgi:hypothetical protein